MAVGALLDAGTPLTVVEEALKDVGLDVEGVSVSAKSIVRSHIHATKFNVALPDVAGAADQRGTDPHQATEHGRHGHSASSYASIIDRIDQSGLSRRVADKAKVIFREIGIAEARIHNASIDDVHFHEVGALDSIADIVAVAACLEHLGVVEVYTSPIPLGHGGLIETQHGRMPLPAPATMEILKGFHVQLTSLPFELTTPTGAGIVKALSRGTIPTELIQIDRVGFGAGTRELPDRPNLLRVIVGELVADEQCDRITLVECNIDDMNPQVYPYLLERLLEVGALDVYLTPVIMKKGRPGMLLTVLATRGAVDEVTKVIYRETTTIGLRYHEASRRRLPREEFLAPTEWGNVRMKRVISPDGVRVTPEFDEARRIARDRALSLHGVIERLDEVARELADRSAPLSR